MEGPRPPRPEELDSLLELLCEVWGYFPETYSWEHLRRVIRQPLYRRDARVMVDGGRVVSNIQMYYHDLSLYGCRVKVASIGCVCTQAEYRRRGLAGAVLGRCLEDMTAAGARLLLVSGDRSLYRRHHCVPAGEFRWSEVDLTSLGGAPSGLRVEQVGVEAWPTLAPLYDAESLRFVRPLEFLSRSCFWWDCNQPMLWRVAVGDRTLGYVNIAQGVPETGARRSPWVYEYAGSRAALVEALGEIGERAGIERLRFAFPAADRELGYLLERAGVTLRPGRLPDHTVRVLDVPGLMRDLRPYVRARLPRAEARRLSFGQVGEVCVIERGAERVELSLSEAAALMLGGDSRPELPAGLAQVAEALFPVPLPMIGLDYI